MIKQPRHLLNENELFYERPEDVSADARLKIEGADEDELNKIISCLISNKLESDGEVTADNQILIVKIKTIIFLTFY